MTGNLSTSAVGTSAASEPKAPTTTIGGASVLPTDRPLTAGDVPLLREGDVLRIDTGGSLHTYSHAKQGGRVIATDKAYYAPCRFTFVRRPATPAASEGEVDSSHGSVYDRLLTFIHDRDHALRGDERTDPSEIDETVLEIMKIAASPPARKEAPGEGAGERLARQFHETYERLAPSFGYETRPDTKAFDPTTPNGRLMIAVCSEMQAALRARTSEPAGAYALLDDMEEHQHRQYGHGFFCTPDAIHPAPAPATADKLRVEIERGLKNFDATSAMCPFNKSPTPPKDKPCPTCSAEKSEGCRREITAAFGFVYAARQALAALEGGEG